jgi:hypothetical protein
MVSPPPADSENPKASPRPRVPHGGIKTPEKIGIWTGILTSIAIAGLTFFQTLDVRHNFTIDQRAWLKVDYGFPEYLAATERLYPRPVGGFLGRLARRLLGGSCQRDEHRGRISQAPGDFHSTLRCEGA